MKRLRPFQSLAIFSLVSAALVMVASNPARAARGKDKPRVDAVFAEFDKPDSPGCALGVIQDGELTYTQGYGMASLEHSAPIDSDTVFRTGSVSKQFAAAAVAILAEAGKLSLDDDIRKHTPELPAYERPITIRHLVHHTSGLRDYAGLAFMAGIDATDHYIEVESLELIARQRGTDFAPGAEYSYSNTGYFLLGQIVKRVSGQSLREYAEEHMFGPLGMKRTHFHDDLSEVIAKRASGYSPLEEGGFRVDMTGWEQIGDGGIFTTLEDLLLWDRNFYENRLGKGNPALIETLETTGKLNDGEAIDYAFGLVVDEYRGLRRVSHGGAWVGFRAQLTRFPEQRFSVAVLCNVGTASPDRYARQVAELYLAEEFKGKADVEKGKDVRAKADKPVKVPEAELRRLAGHYWNDRYKLRQKIAVEKGQLVYKGGSGGGTPLRPVGSDRFVLEEDESTEVRFPGSQKGEARTMIVASEGEEPIEFEAFEPVSPSPKTLGEYSGSYYCDELDAQFTIEPDGRELDFAVGHLSDKTLAPLFPDVFQYDDWLTFAFERDESGQVDHMSLDTGRVRNLACSRRRG